MFPFGLFPPGLGLGPLLGGLDPFGRDPFNPQTLVGRQRVARREYEALERDMQRGKALFTTTTRAGGHAGGQRARSGGGGSGDGSCAVVLPVRRCVRLSST